MVVYAVQTLPGWRTIEKAGDVARELRAPVGSERLHYTPGIEGRDSLTTMSPRASADATHVPRDKFRWPEQPLRVCTSCSSSSWRVPPGQIRTLVLTALTLAVAH